ncbi:hypothetical protein ACFQMH_07550, partial [Streptomyces viridiviolaceus]
MSQVPEPLRWAAYITGTELPEADPDLLRRQGEIWGALARQFEGMVGEINAVNASVQGNVNGDPAEAFGTYMRSLNSTLPALARAAENLQVMSDDFALQVEHAVRLVEAMLAWMLVELAFLANSLFGLAAAPALITGVRQVIMAILRRLLISAAAGTAMMTGLETLLQFIEILEGHRKRLDPNAIRDMAVGGAIGGAAFGAFSGIGRQIAPRFADSALGRAALGGAAGVVGGAGANAALDADQNLGLAFLAGAAGAMLSSPGGGGNRKQETDPVPDVADIVKSLPDDPSFGGSGGDKSALGIDPVVAPGTASTGSTGTGTRGSANASEPVASVPDGTGVGVPDTVTRVPEGTGGPAVATGGRTGTATASSAAGEPGTAGSGSGARVGESGTAGTATARAGESGTAGTVTARAGESGTAGTATARVGESSAAGVATGSGAGESGTAGAVTARVGESGTAGAATARAGESGTAGAVTARVGESGTAGVATGSGAGESGTAGTSSGSRAGEPVRVTDPAVAADGASTSGERPTAAALPGFAETSPVRGAEPATGESAGTPAPTTGTSGGGTGTAGGTAEAGPVASAGRDAADSGPAMTGRDLADNGPAVTGRTLTESPAEGSATGTTESASAPAGTADAVSPARTAGPETAAGAGDSAPATAPGRATAPDAEAGRTDQAGTAAEPAVGAGTTPAGPALSGGPATPVAHSDTASPSQSTSDRTGPAPQAGQPEGPSATAGAETPAVRPDDSGTQAAAARTEAAVGVQTPLARPETTAPSTPPGTTTGGAGSGAARTDAGTVGARTGETGGVNPSGLRTEVSQPGTTAGRPDGAGTTGTGREAPHTVRPSAPTDAAAAPVRGETPSGSTASGSGTTARGTGEPGAPRDASASARPTTAAGARTEARPPREAGQGRGAADEATAPAHRAPGQTATENGTGPTGQDQLPARPAETEPATDAGTAPPVRADDGGEPPAPGPDDPATTVPDGGPAADASRPEPYVFRGEDPEQAARWRIEQTRVVGEYRTRFETEQDRYWQQREADQRVEAAFAAHLENPDPVHRRPDADVFQDVPPGADENTLAQARARAELVRQEWQQQVKSWFDDRWKADFEEYRRGDIARSEFALRFAELVDGLPDDVEITAATRLARRVAEESFDALSGADLPALRAGDPESLDAAVRARPPAARADEALRDTFGADWPSLPEHVVTRAREAFTADAAAEVHRVASGLRGAEGERVPVDWSRLHTGFDTGMRELTQGLRTRLELEAAADDIFVRAARAADVDLTVSRAADADLPATDAADTAIGARPADPLADSTGTDATTDGDGAVAVAARTGDAGDPPADGRGQTAGSWLDRARADFRAEFDELTRTLPGDGRAVRRIAWDEWLDLRSAFEPRLNDLAERWQARLRAGAAEEELRLRAVDEAETARAQWSGSTGRDPVEAATVDMDAVVAGHRADLAAEGDAFLAGRSPRELSAQEWEAYGDRMRQAHERLVADLPTRLEYQVGLDRALTQADLLFQRARAEGPLAERAQQGLREDIRREFGRLAGRAEDGTWGPDRVAAGEDVFVREYLPDAERSVPARLEFERATERTLLEGGERFHDLTADRSLLTERARRNYTVDEETFDRLSGDFRTDWMRGYHDIYGPPARDLTNWMRHERENGDTFGSTVRSEWETLRDALQAPFDAAARARADADAALAREQGRQENLAWRQQVAANFQGVLGKGAALDDLAARAEIGPAEVRSARVLAEYQRDLSELRSWFSREWDAAARTTAPDGAAAVRAALTEEARQRWDTLAGRTRQQDEAYAAWQREPAWTLDLASLQISRTPLEAAGRADGAGPLPRAEGDQQVQLQQTVAREDRTATAGAPDTAATRTDGPRTDGPRAAVPTADTVAGLPAAVRTRDQAYGAFESRLADFPALRSPQAVDRVAAVREAFADAWAADRTASGPAELTPARTAALDDLTGQLASVRDDLAARARAREIFERDIATALPGRDGAAFAASAQAAAVVQEFEEAGPSVERPAETLTEQFRQRYTDAYHAWLQDRQARAAFDAALRTTGPDGRQTDLTEGRAQWTAPVQRWYERQLAALRESHAAEWSAVTAIQDAEERAQRLDRMARDTREAALHQQRRAPEAVAENRRLAEYTARFTADRNWSSELTTWYEQQRRALVEPLSGRLDGLASRARAEALARFGEQAAALHEVAEARHRAEEDFARGLSDLPGDSVRMTHAATAEWTRRHIGALREAYVHQVETDTADGPAGESARVAETVPAPSYADARDWRVPAWQAAQRELHQYYAELLADADGSRADAADVTGDGPRAETAGDTGSGVFDETFAQWSRDGAPPLSEEQLTEVRDSVLADHGRITEVTVADRRPLPEELRDAFSLAAVRHVALDRGDAAFDRAFQLWGQRLTEAWRHRLDDGTRTPFELTAELATTVREEAAAGFRDRWEQALRETLAGVDARAGLDGAVREAGGRLRELVASLAAEFDRHALLHGQLARLDSAFEELAESFHDRLGPEERELLAALGAENATVSAPGRLRVLSEARDTLRQRFEQLFPTAAGVAGLVTDGGPLPSQWLEGLRDLLRSLPARLAVQAAREAEILRSQQAVADAATAWAESGPEIGATFLDRFAVDFTQVRPMLRGLLDVTVAAGVNARFERVFGTGDATTTAPGTAQERLERWRTAYAELTDPERLHTWLTLRHARGDVTTVADRLFADQLDRWRAAHGAEALSEAETARARAGLDERLLAAFDALFTDGPVARDELAGVLRRWDAVLAAEAGTLPAHFAFESGVGAALRGAARSFEGLRGDRAAYEDRVAELAAGFRDDFLAAYERLWAPQPLSSSWADHEAAHADYFTGALAAERLRDADGPTGRDGEAVTVRAEEELERTLADGTGRARWDRAVALLRPAPVIGQDPEDVALRQAQHRALLRIAETLGDFPDTPGSSALAQARDLADRLAAETPGIRSTHQGLRGGMHPAQDTAAVPWSVAEAARQRADQAWRSRPWISAADDVPQSAQGGHGLNASQVAELSVWLSEREERNLAGTVLTFGSVADHVVNRWGVRLRRDQVHTLHRAYRQDAAEPSARTAERLGLHPDYLVHAWDFYRRHQHLEPSRATTDSRQADLSMYLARFRDRAKLTKLPQALVDWWESIGMRWSTEAMTTLARQVIRARSTGAPPPDAEIRSLRVDASSSVTVDLAHWRETLRHTDPKTRGVVQRKLGEAWLPAPWAEETEAGAG